MRPDASVTTEVALHAQATQKLLLSRAVAAAMTCITSMNVSDNSGGRHGDEPAFELDTIVGEETYEAADD